MVRKEHIENFLRLNDISLEADDDEIRGVLIAARWHKDDVDAAILILRGEPCGPASKREWYLREGERLFQTDIPLAPETLSSLLGIPIVLRPRDPYRDAQKYRAAKRRSDVLYALYLAALAAGILFLAYALFGSMRS